MKVEWGQSKTILMCNFRVVYAPPLTNCGA